jgi:hypothetical protein
VNIQDFAVFGISLQQNVEWFLLKEISDLTESSCEICFVIRSTFSSTKPLQKNSELSY